MTRTPVYIAHRGMILGTFGPLTPLQARERIAAHAETPIALGKDFEPVAFRMIGDLITAIREAETYAPANDGDDFTPPPAAAAAVPQMERAAA